ncbi:MULTISPECIES: plasmid replication protein RepC [unclassified Shinella]|uniref:plasmid replication protein RepC n=1 Tax=unclassified Shinella TaxID=2643062 RepID=UPI00225C6FCC|nr:plasmid replication protein RepC [Shinella sp. YE25]MDC7259065.1 replication initiation protein RepC [Shinella sp. YE25]CAI0335843.1 putative replication protein C [Rhizobiaceae bacterium]
MMEQIATTPFGGGRMSARLFLRQRAAAERQEKLRAGAGGNDSGRADKWQLMRAVTEARRAYGIGDRTISVLEALVSFASERELDGTAPIIVFPSNRELSLRARGMAPATIRRHLAALVEAGLIFRRDSANGKRFCRRDETGGLEDAFGFDLAPLALRAGEIFEAAEAVRAEDRAQRALRGEVTLHQRDIAKIIATALEEGRGGDWLDYSARLAALAAGLGRRAARGLLTDRRTALQRLRAEVENAYLSSLSEEEMSGSDLQTEQHIQNSNTDQNLESCGRETQTAKAVNAARPAPEQKMAISLDRLVRLCPDIADYGRDGVTSWADLLAAADLVRAMLGISPDAWRKAKAAMGEQAAAVVIAALLQRGEAIRSPGGYLRDLTEKAGRGAFSIYPMLQALEREEGRRI